MKNSIKAVVFLICGLSQIAGCKKDNVEVSTTLEVMKLGTTDFQASLYGIRGFNQKGNPIITHQNGIMYEWNDVDNSFRKIGPLTPMSAEAFSRVAQDKLGDYYFENGEVYKLNKTSNVWELVSIATGVKDMVANQNGDILVYVDNSINSGLRSFYLKKSNNTQWNKIADKPAVFDQDYPQYNSKPKFLSNSGLAFFNQFNDEGQIDGQGTYSENVLDVNTKTFKKLTDFTDPANFNIINGKSFTCDYISPNGVFYVSRNKNPMGEVYKLNTSLPSPIFEKVTAFDVTFAEENGIAMDIDEIVLNESTGKIKVAIHCYNGFNPHWNLGETKLGTSKLTLKEHDKGQRGVFVSPTGNVFILRGSVFYLWK